LQEKGYLSNEDFLKIEMELFNFLLDHGYFASEDLIKEIYNTVGENLDNDQKNKFGVLIEQIIIWSFEYGNNFEALLHVLKIDEVNFKEKINSVKVYEKLFETITGMYHIHYDSDRNKLDS
jgi:hypothetical protein